MKSEKEICKKNFEKILSMRSFLKFSQPTAGEKKFEENTVDEKKRLHFTTKLALSTK